MICARQTQQRWRRRLGTMNRTREQGPRQRRPPCHRGLERAGAPAGRVDTAGCVPLLVACRTEVTVLHARRAPVPRSAPRRWAPRARVEDGRSDASHADP